MKSERNLTRKKVNEFLALSLMGLLGAGGTGCIPTQQQTEAIEKATGNDESRANKEDESSDYDSSDVPVIAPSPSAAPSPVGGSGDGSSPAVVQRDCYQEEVVQPDEQILRSVDLLLVVDTSGSMQDNRVGVAKGLSSFVEQLPSNVDYRVGVLLAHGSKSKYSGKLWAPANQGAVPYPRVIDSKTHSLAAIQGMLTTIMMTTPSDPGDTQGETGLYSFTNMLKSSNLAEAKAAGFFRDSAALAVVFISDENDVCAVYPEKPATQTGMTSSEELGRKMDCPNGISSEQVVSAVKAVMGDRPSILGAVVNNDISKSYRGNDGYGWGYMDLVDKTHGVSVDIEGGDYVTGLAEIGSLVTRKLELILQKTLSHHDNVDASSVSVSLNGRAAAFRYEPSTFEVHFLDPGTARSVLTIDYCSMPVVPPVVDPCVEGSCGPPGDGVIGI